MDWRSSGGCKQGGGIGTTCRANAAPAKSLQSKKCGPDDGERVASEYMLEIENNPEH